MARERSKADDSEASLLDRRSYLKMAGTAAAAVAAGTGSATAAGSAGYGEGGYGNVAYGGVNPDTAPTIERFDVSKSEQLGDDRMFSVNWTVADAGNDLSVVEVVVNRGVDDLNFTVEDVTGGSASGWKLFQFTAGTTVDVTLRVKDESGNVVKNSKTVTL